MHATTRHTQKKCISHVSWSVFDIYFMYIGPHINGNSITATRSSGKGCVVTYALPKKTQKNIPILRARINLKKTNCCYTSFLSPAFFDQPNNITL